MLLFLKPDSAQQYNDPQHNKIINDLFGVALSAVLWEGIDSEVAKKGLTPEAFKDLCDSNDHDPAFYLFRMQHSQFIGEVAVDAETFDVPTVDVIGENINLLELLVTGQMKKVKTAEVEPESSNVDEMEVTAIVKDILNTYDKLYAPSFINRPMGF